MITSATSSADSDGSGIRLTATGSTSAAASINRAIITGNGIVNFPAGAGVSVVGEQLAATGPTVVVGASTAQPITISNNTIRGESTTNRMGTSAIFAALSGRGSGAFDISGNTLSNTSREAVSLGGFGPSTTSFVVDGNGIDQSLAAGIDVRTGQTASTTEAPRVDATITNNTIANTDGPGILAAARDATGQLNARIQNNTVAAPLGAFEPGIFVGAGSSTSTGDRVCLDISGNTTAGSSATAGIGLRLQSGPNVFGVVGMSATASPGVEAYVSGLNPLSALGTELLAATTGFSSCTLP